ncbi:radical SAM family heme chaperone HemW [Neptunicoccus cionae]|uniref:Heme chaperone HemW n=1 Tax=Neptunicoccus cionae TaxID=2035344 RepID=A0A916QXH2_9RHOB|nr:radical SAM family heme chaperone HemW [Amylibacter cionae]GGA18790.1 coproporphyrinogen III oxidase [Amylibacter cionae]
MTTEDWQNAGFGVYVHWPFCAAKCPYCDFNSHVRQSVDQTAWVRAFVAEIKATAALTPNRTVDTIFFGGGTPSLMLPETVDTIIQEIGQYWTLSPNVEITLEANPTSVEAGRFKGFSDAGVNRISMGIQALNDTDLRALGRMHSVAEARQAFDVAKKYFDNVSFDLIYARQNQTLSDWRQELTQAIDMAVDHLSLYQLTIEQGTRFGDLFARKRLRGLPTDELSADLYDLTQDVCAENGLVAYEVSNHARVGAECKHNLIYWRYGDYAGIGPGAHGRLSLNAGRVATDAPLLPENWLETVERDGTANRVAEEISRDDQAAEYAMMSLRLSEGCDLERVEAISPRRLDLDAARELIQDGFLSQSNSHLRTTGQGKMVLNAILGKLLAGEQN